MSFVVSLLYSVLVPVFARLYRQLQHKRLVMKAQFRASLQDKHDATHNRPEQYLQQTDVRHKFRIAGL